MIRREYYINRIQPYLGKPVIKAIVGMRHVGKSVFVRQIMDSLRSRGIPESNIIYVDMEQLHFDFIKDCHALNEYVENRAAGTVGKIYVFIDEIQDIAEWERAVASWSGQAERYDIVITGSNSTMFSGELATRLTGRYIEFHIHPLSFKEFLEFYPEYSGTEEAFRNYLRYGGMPGLRMLDKLSDDAVIPFLRSIHDSIVLKDIVDRKKLRNTALLERIFNFAYDNIAKPISASGICRYLKNQQISTNVQSTVNYLSVLTESQLFVRAERFDIKGKKHLEINEKLYASDLGLRHARIGFKANDISQITENIVFNELCRRFDNVRIGSVDGYEVDFVAEKNSERQYFQATVSCNDPDTLERESRSLLAIQDNYPKMIISLEQAYSDNISGVKIVSLKDFLLG